MVDAPHPAIGDVPVIAVLACAWGVLAGLPFVRRARRVAVAERSSRLTRRRARPRRPAIRRHLDAFGPLSSVRRVASAPARARRARRRADDFARELAVAVDLVGVGVAAGCTPYTAVQLGAQWVPPLIARALEGVVHACALGQSFDDALRELGTREPAARPLTDTLRTSARLGSPVAPALARLASDVRGDLRRRAETRARTVPVRMCFPLVGCILPAFALLTVVPVVLDGLHR
jgi:hypothetical protein